MISTLWNIFIFDDLSEEIVKKALASSAVVNNLSQCEQQRKYNLSSQSWEEMFSRVAAIKYPETDSRVKQGPGL